MLGLLRSAVTASRRVLPTTVEKALAVPKVTALPFVPTDWVFRFFPYFCRDRVRFMLRFNQISFGMGLGYFYLWCHAPYKCDNYDHFYESPLYLKVKGDLEKAGELEENLRIKVKHFSPPKP